LTQPLFQVSGKRFPAEVYKHDDEPKRFRKRFRFLRDLTGETWDFAGRTATRHKREKRRNHCELQALSLVTRFLFGVVQIQVGPLNPLSTKAGLALPGHSPDCRVLFATVRRASQVGSAIPPLNNNIEFVRQLTRRRFNSKIGLKNL